ncbi:hypothetical protein HanXRQr2_Chr14g0647391 [Helianthus annuus]|uniref:Uncharacterized protein n=1 Tax=Helianthus annuus TaxID=4232 RepID=A0A9K3E8X8_HELAN|nr:hypothetical protein HanXRQr2_Chr14g0647391 [Helianthus annuus]
MTALLVQPSAKVPLGVTSAGGPVAEGPGDREGASEAPGGVAVVGEGEEGAGEGTGTGTAAGDGDGVGTAGAGAGVGDGDGDGVGLAVGETVGVAVGGC